MRLFAYRWSIPLQRPVLLKKLPRIRQTVTVRRVAVVAILTRFSRIFRVRESNPAGEEGNTDQNDVSDNHGFYYASASRIKSIRAGQSEESPDPNSTTPDT